eukprot:Gregarina_sp_Poly_1__5438@NODE_2874_length_1608_cov_1459_152498_g1815_i0_p1_GENE_NODE_2874_length_1608_cov_1459_152498_g1815_i0NODE_2874_length_1608_cov_1459_152498_g1815_i0_p1_ORF_typecomplete_len454_score50_45UDPGT/PF00201_18/9_1e41Glyco_tran_28_C/PF04101_16/1_9e03Glyco_tran_28_C/PF04101_16/0_006_NODE_2874_length_1608_cov_1459_152498_g1815_i01141475
MAPLHIALVSCPGIGHVGPLLAFGSELVAAQQDTIATIFGLLPEDQVSKVPTSQLPSKVRFHAIRIPAMLLPFDPYYEEHAKDFVSDMMAYIDSNHLPKPSCHIYDMFVGWSSLLAENYSIPTFLFMPCSMRAFGTFLSIDMKQLLKAPPDFEVKISEVESIPRSDVVSGVSDGLWKFFERCMVHWRASDGILINDVEELSSKELLERMARLATRKPRLDLFNIGPVGLGKCGNLVNKSDECIEWLDTHPKESVVYVALGSWCELPAQDYCELAHALKALDAPVLWAHRPPSGMVKKDLMVSYREREEEVGEDSLPINFGSEMNPAKFKIVAWVDQKAVLRHPSVRMFVSHCGWNSTLEAVTLMGKPVAALPVGAEQGLNAHELAVRWKVGKRLWSCEPTRKLQRNEVLKDIQETMNSPAFKENAAAIHDIVCRAASPSGSSPRNLARFFKSL